MHLRDVSLHIRPLIVWGIPLDAVRIAIRDLEKKTRKNEKRVRELVGRTFQPLPHRCDLWPGTIRYFDRSLSLPFSHGFFFQIFAPVYANGISNRALQAFKQNIIPLLKKDVSGHFFFSNSHHLKKNKRNIPRRKNLRIGFERTTAILSIVREEEEHRNIK